jgi:hypothetical protein
MGAPLYPSTLTSDTRCSFSHMAILSRMSLSEMCGAGVAICIAVREMWGNGDDGVFGVVLTEEFVSAI